MSFVTIIYDPRFYAVTHARCVDTPDGPMYALRIVQDVENPALEPIAEGYINNEYIYLWRDHCWAIAVDKDGKRVLKEDTDPDNDWLTAGFGGAATLGQEKLTIAPPMCNKVMVVHRVGQTTIE